MTLTVDPRSWSRRLRMNEFKAALDTEYAGILGAGKIARLELVL